MKKILPILLIVVFVLISFTIAFSLSSNNKPSWSDLYYKKVSIAKGWKFIVIHHSATASGNAGSFHKYHTDQGYGGLCYHFVVGNGKGSPDGKVEQGFRWKQQIAGTHVDINSWYHNIFGIGICLVGNFEKEKPTQKQITSLNKLIAKLSNQYSIPKENIIGHNQVPFSNMEWDVKEIRANFIKGKTAQTVCPGNNLSNF
jgi:N-acetyl-anhydromuramyl-L-alanine amidase AmpD